LGRARRWTRVSGPPGADGHWYVLGYPWLSIGAKDRRSAVATTRAAVAEWLDVETDAFDVEAG